jgi:sec-independent protein translocase protein TatA
MVLPLAFLDFLGFQGILLLAILGVLLYGERLPEVAASFGKQFMQLKKSVQGIRNEIESVAFDAKHSVTRSMEQSDDSSREEATAPKFEPPPAEPAASGSAAEPAEPSLAPPPTMHDSGV